MGKTKKTLEKQKMLDIAFLDNEKLRDKFQGMEMWKSVKIVL